MEEVVGHTGLKVLMKVDKSNASIVLNPLGILGQKFRPHPTHLVNIIMIKIIIFSIISSN
jgi:hypothetical protein